MRYRLTHLAPMRPLPALAKRIAATPLFWLVCHDYRLRALGLRPDRWHWADRALYRMGLCVAPRA